MISTIWILNLGRSARPEVVHKGILKDEGFKSGLEGWIELREGWGEHSREENAQVVQKYALLCLKQWGLLPNLWELSICEKWAGVCEEEKQSIRNHSEGWKLAEEL